MSRASKYSLNCNNNATTASAIETTNNPLSSSYTKLSFVIWTDPNGGVNNGYFGRWVSVDGDILFRQNGATLQFYIREGGSTYGPASGTGGWGAGFQCRGFRFDGSAASGNRLSAFQNGVKLTDASGPASMSAMAVTPKFGYGGSGSMLGWQGEIKNAFLWVGKALPDSAYAAIAAGVHPLVFGPTHWWPMDNTLADLVGNNPLTNMGANVSHSAVGGAGWISLPSSVIIPHRVAAAGGGEQVPPGILTLTPGTLKDKIKKFERPTDNNILLSSTAPSLRVVTPTISELIPPGSLTLSAGTPSTRQISPGQTLEQIAPGFLTLTGTAPLTRQAGKIIKSVPSSNLYLVSYNPNIPSRVIAKRTAGGGPKPQKGKIVVIGGQRRIVTSYTELKRLLEIHLEDQQQELHEVEAKEPKSRKAITLKRNVTRAETRLAKADEEYKRIQQENEEILLMFSA